MAVFGTLKIYIIAYSALVILNHALITGGSAADYGYCSKRTCGDVEIRYPFILQDDIIGRGECYTDYPHFRFHCVNQSSLYLNFTANISLSNDMYQVTKTDYYSQTLSLVPSVSAAICRPFDATRFGGLKITNTSSLLLDCPNDLLIQGMRCSNMSGASISSSVCDYDSTGTATRWACGMNINDFSDVAYNSCHLMESNFNDSSVIIDSYTTLELQFEGNRTLSFLDDPLSPIPSPVPTPNGVDSQDSGKSSKRKKRLSPILGIVVGSLTGMVAIIIFLFCMRFWYRRIRSSLGSTSTLTTERFIQQNIEKMKEHKHQLTTLYTLKELQKATKNFSNDFKLGSGGFGTVYKGILDNGMEVAIKKTNHVNMKGSEQYMNEVSLLLQVNHRNLVKLHGCCIEVEVPMLVYEYLPNGDLFQHLQGERLGMQLTWAKRLQIAIDIAEALRYLHSAAYPPIYHRDIKTSNILLDDKFNVKVADFGISRLVKPEATHVSTGVQGTPGYLDPEYFHNWQLTDKSDVYSFGMVLLELITSLKPVDFERGEDDVNLKSMTMPFIQTGNMKAIADTRLLDGNASESYEIIVEMQKMAQLASKCLADYRRHRPSMKEVVVELVAIKKRDNLATEVDEMGNIFDKEMEMAQVLENQSSRRRGT